MNETIRPFLWAQGKEANIQEPIEALREHGWRYGDVPAASNFNWLFNRIQKDLETLRGDLSAFKENILSELNSVKENAAVTKTIASRALANSNTNHRNVDFSIGVSRQICRELRAMEENI